MCKYVFGNVFHLFKGTAYKLTEFSTQMIIELCPYMNSKKLFRILKGLLFQQLNTIIQIQLFKAVTFTYVKVHNDTLKR